MRCMTCLLAVTVLAGPALAAPRFRRLPCLPLPPLRLTRASLNLVAASSSDLPVTVMPRLDEVIMKGGLPVPPITSIEGL
jgi:hypothetical protein